MLSSDSDFENAFWFTSFLRHNSQWKKIKKKKILPLDKVLMRTSMKFQNFFHATYSMYITTSGDSGTRTTGA